MLLSLVRLPLLCNLDPAVKSLSDLNVNPHLPVDTFIQLNLKMVFIAVDPFQVSHWKQLDASLDQLTFDNIQVSTSAPEPKVIVACPLHLGGNLPNNTSSYGQNHSSTQSNISSVPASHIYSDTSSSAIPSAYHSSVVGQKHGDTVTHISTP